MDRRFAMFSLFTIYRSDREYLWFAIFLLLIGLMRYVVAASAFATFHLDWFFLAMRLLGVGADVALLFFIYVMMNGSKRSYFLYAAVLGTAIQIPMPDILESRLGALHLPTLQLLANMAKSAVAIWIVGVVVRRAFGKRLDARLILVPLILYESEENLYPLVAFIFRRISGHRLRAPSYIVVLSEPFTVHLEVLVDLLFLLALLAILLNRFLVARRQEARIAGELQAARTVQQLLMPSKLPQVPCFEMEVAYLPAQEVGGDFFHIAPGADGSLLIVVGDVSGKGLGAAFTVSTLIGALRDFEDRLPSAVLGHLNRVLFGHTSGFATCCALLVDATGQFRIANAGHLSPYVNGVELATEAGLPLGLIAEADHGDTNASLKRGDRLTLISDGVVEASSPKGELYGFHRTQAISHLTASSIAEAARTFGQNDDITVMSIDFRPHPAG